MGGKEENQLSGNYPAVGSGAHDTVFIESSLQLLIPRSRVNPFQAAVPARGGGRTQDWGRPTGSGSAASRLEGGVVSGQSPVPSRRKYTSDLGSGGTRRGRGTGRPAPPGRRPGSSLGSGAGSEPMPCPAGGLRPLPRTAAAGPIRPRAHPGCLSGPAASSSPPRPSASRGRPRPPLGPGLAAAATRQRSAASPRPRVPRAGRGAVSACVAWARAGGGGLCPRPSGAGPPDRVLCPPSQDPPRVRGAARLRAPGSGGRHNPTPPQACRRGGWGTVGPALPRRVLEEAGGCL